MKRKLVSWSRRLLRYRRLEDYPKFPIGRPKHNILLTIARFDYLSAPQITKLVFGTKVLTYVREHLKDLYQSGYIERLYLPSPQPYGTSLAIYCLARKGVAYLRKLGLAPAGRFSPSEQAEREWMFLRHTLSANDLLIQCHLIQRQDPAVKLVKFVTERELKRNPGVARLKSRNVTVIPDGWIHLTRAWPSRDKPSNYYICWELDRGTIEQVAFRRKIHTLLVWLDDEKGYEQRFGVRGAAIAVVTTHSKKRLADLVNWTEKELQARNAAYYSDLFLLTHCDPAELDSTAFSYGRIWAQPLSKNLVALVEEPK